MSHLIPVWKDDEIFTLLFCRPWNRYHCSWHIPPLTSHHPNFLLLCFPLHPIPHVDPICHLWSQGGLSFSAINCSFFKLLSGYMKTALFSMCSPFLWWDSWRQKWWQSGLATALLPSCAHRSLSSPLSATFLPTAEWWFWWVRATCMVSRKCGAVSWPLGFLFSN